MLRIEEIRDAEMLRQVAVLLERENAQLHTKVQDLTRELSRLRGEDASAVQRQLEFLKELLAHREHALFGASSEKRLAPPASAAPPAPLPHRGHGPKAQPRLPRVDVVHQLDEADRVCPACGGTLREMPGQTEDASGARMAARVVMRNPRREITG